MNSKGSGGRTGPRTLSLFARNKRKGVRTVVLTAYDLTSARIAAAGGVDAILVGDSVGMVVLGHENTLPVTIEDMIHHCRAVLAARPGLPVIADLPYGSFHISTESTVRDALRLVKESGVQAVKLEGGRKRAAVIEALLDAEIPVMGHLGLTPQSVHRFGGFKVQGKGDAEAERLLDEARFLAEAGCFAIVLECIPARLAERISQEVRVPTIGIGAGAGCDGQVLVFHDMLGLFDGLKPKFVKRYAELGRIATEAVAEYAREVREGAFPTPDHTFGDRAHEKSEAPEPTCDPPAEVGYLPGVQTGED